MYVKRGIVEGRAVFPVLICITFLLSAVFAGIEAGETRNGQATIYGYIRDDTGSPIAGAAIILITMDGSQYNITSSNETGYYMINATFFGINRVAVKKDSYIEYTNYIFLDNTTYANIDFTLRPIPAETESVGGTVTYEGGSYAEGVEVILLYEDEGNRHEYNDVTDSVGDYDFIVFPAPYKMEIKLDGLNVYEEEVDIDSGGGPYDFDVVLPSLPPKDAEVRGYLKDGDDPVAGAMVGVMDANTEIVNMTFTNETGYFNLGFWEGQHYLISMLDGYDSYFRGIQVSAGEIHWFNISVYKEEFEIKGWVVDPDGLPVNGVRVQFIKPYTFPDDNSDTTNEMGYFEFDVSGGAGYLMVVDDNPFEPGEFDVYFDKIEDLDDNMTVNIELTQNDYLTGAATMKFDGWSSFSSTSRMALPVNNTKASRAYVDMMMGNGDLKIDQDEFDLWVEAMTGEDSDMSEGPFGLVTDDNLTIDGMGYHMNESSFHMEFVNFTGPIDSQTRMELHQRSNYSLDVDLTDASSHVVKFNASYSEGREMSTMTAHTPMGWIITDISETVHEIVHSEGMLEMSTTEDPDDEDDIDHEWITMTYHDNSFEAEVNEPEEPVEGEPFNISVNVTDYLPENTIYYTYDFGDNTTLNTNDTEVTHTYADNGSYDVLITISDNYTREIVEEFTLEVGNLDPVGTLEVQGGLNRTFAEGDHVTFVLNATDVPADPLTVAWSLNGEEFEVLDYDDVNRTREIKLMDDGNHTMMVLVDDGDGGILDLNISLDAVNLDPSFVTGIEISGGKENAIQGDKVKITLMSMMDASPEDILTFNWTIPGEGYEYTLSNDNMTLEMMMLEVGEFNITLVVMDDDGGESTMVKTISVGENLSYDRDGDGIPRWWEEQYGMSDDDASDAGLDNDGDNLTNKEEYEGETDPTDEDTDDDKVPDDYDDDPKDPNVLGYDTDEDGHSDWDEVLNGTDPLDADDYPGKKKDDDGNIFVWIMLLAIALIIILIIIVYMIASNKERGLYSEE